MTELTAAEHRDLDYVADAIVTVAKASHPDDPQAFADCALALAMGIARPVSVVSNESLTLTPAELEQRIASPGAKFGGRR